MHLLDVMECIRSQKPTKKKHATEQSRGPVHLQYWCWQNAVLLGRPDVKRLAPGLRSQNPIKGGYCRAFAQPRDSMQAAAAAYQDLMSIPLFAWLYLVLLSTSLPFVIQVLVASTYANRYSLHVDELFQSEELRDSANHCS